MHTHVQHTQTHKHTYACKHTHMHAPYHCWVTFHSILLLRRLSLLSHYVVPYCLGVLANNRLPRLEREVRLIAWISAWEDSSMSSDTVPPIHGSAGDMASKLQAELHDLQRERRQVRKLSYFTCERHLGSGCAGCIRDGAGRGGCAVPSYCAFSHINAVPCHLMQHAQLAVQTVRGWAEPAE